MVSMITQLVELASRAIAVRQRSRSDDREVRRTRSRWYIDTWCAAAAEIGASVDISPDGLLAVRRGQRVTWVRESLTDLDGGARLRAAGDKRITSSLLRSIDVPTPPQVSFTLADLEPARKFLALHGRCVVKPATGTSAGAGVTTSVLGRSDLYRAALRAAGYASEMLIEPQIEGREVRVLVLDGSVVEAVLRRPPTLVGDGDHTVSQLVDLNNARRRFEGLDRAQHLLTKDLEMRRSLASDGLTLRSIPERGATIRVKTVVHENELGDCTNVTDQIAEGTRRACTSAAGAMGVRLAGVDIITPDITADLDEVGGVVLEINTTPGLFHHQGETGNRVASLILAAALGDILGTAR